MFSPQTCAAPFPPAGAAAAQLAKEPVRRFCDGLLPLKAEIQSNPEQPEPPRIAAARITPKEQEGVRGKAPFCLNIHLPLSPLANSPLGSRGTRMPPAALRARVDDPSTRESGLSAAGQACFEESTQSASRKTPVCHIHFVMEKQNSKPCNLSGLLLSIRRAHDRCALLMITAFCR